MTDETRPVALTAQVTAKARAIESQQVNALFHDPWADLFAGKAGGAWLARQQSAYPGPPLILGTRFFDDFFADRMGNMIRGPIAWHGWRERASTRSINRRRWRARRHYSMVR